MSSYKQALEADSSYVHLEESASMPIFVTTKNLLYHKIEIKMGTKVIVKFRIKPKRANAPATGKSKSSTENLLITMRVTYGVLRTANRSNGRRAPRRSTSPSVTTSSDSATGNVALAYPTST